MARRMMIFYQTLSLVSPLIIEEGVSFQILYLTSNKNSKWISSMISRYPKKVLIVRFIKNLTLRFAQQSLADGKLRELFPLRRKQHTMDTRRKEKYQVFRAHTERYRNSPIRTMQRLLNEDRKYSRT